MSGIGEQAPIPPADPVLPAEPPPLRELVLGGRFLGAKAGEAAARVAEAVAGGLSFAGWFGGALAGRMAADRDLARGLIDRDIAAIDAMIGHQLDEILHSSRLQRLEGSWRGLFWLVAGVRDPARVRLRVLPVSWAEMTRDIERAAEFDQSNLFKAVYENEFGIAGGEPYGLLVVDHELRHRPAPGFPTDDPATLAGLAAIAAAAFAPAVLGGSPALLGADEWSDLALTTDPAAALRDPEHARWRKLAARDDMRFVAVTLPRLLARPPWPDDPARRDGFRYRERAPDAASRVWMSPAYAMAANAVRAFQDHGWPADLRGVDPDREGGGVVTELPFEDFSTDPHGVWLRSPVELVLNERQERSLVEGALVPVNAMPFTPDAAFIALRSLQVPQDYVSQTANDAGAAASANARLSAQFHAVLCVSRFAHYIKVMARDLVGSFKSADEIERRLQDWLRGYVNSNVNAGPDTRARAPLLNGKVEVRELAGRPGVFGCVIQLQPHFQLEDLATTFRLTTDINANRQAA